MAVLLTLIFITVPVVYPVLTGIANVSNVIMSAVITVLHLTNSMELSVSFAVTYMLSVVLVLLQVVLTVYLLTKSMEVPAFPVKHFIKAVLTVLFQAV